MSVSSIASAVEIFTTRLSTLEHLLKTGATHFPGDGDAYLAKRLAVDMHPLGTQVAFTCNQPRNFSLWLNGAPTIDLDPHVESLATALRYIEETKDLLRAVTADDAALSTQKRLELGAGLYADLTGHQYLHDFLMPNFYFHLVTAYAILRMSGVQIGKRDYMVHLIPHVTRSAT
ncbi:hypothetical protein SOCEGT47_043360 [Sorangium cellulosum]|jgi:hypothetical protein|uniref:DUF1993 domain-containing protein n=1 Tax=Sorangium cellulosum TaxID=56 RepID=A0A4P2Q452_SORCE|nr:DUF1993 domain-containing protein [Sorangium cellulosum]AUX23806.1 hypothetical protein SOCEGT47_043360 [Sorangium cellulosum]